MEMSIKIIIRTISETSAIRHVTLSQHAESIYCISLPSATKLRRLCFCTCLSVILFTGGVCYPSMYCRWYPSMPCSRGVCAIPACIAGGIPACLAAGGCLLLGGVCSCRSACSRGVPAPGKGLGDPPWKQTGTVADGTHPTGMHSCFGN